MTQPPADRSRPVPESAPGKMAIGPFAGRSGAAQTYSISDLSREFTITPRTLRFYEGKGLLEPKRDGTARIYSYRDRARLMLILRGKRLGFSLAEIHELLGLYDLGDGQVTQMRTLLDRSRVRIGALRRQRQDIDDAIAELSEGCVWIEDFLRAKAN